MERQVFEHDYLPGLKRLDRATLNPRRALALPRIQRKIGENLGIAHRRLSNGIRPKQILLKKLTDAAKATVRIPMPIKNMWLADRNSFRCQ
jgi:hypothetical protein